MNRAPRDSSQPLFSRHTLFISLLQGCIVLATVISVFGLSLYLGESEQTIRALTFTTLIFSNLGLILTNRSWSRTFIATLRFQNKALIPVVAGAIAFLLTTLYVPFFATLFKVTALNTLEFGACLTAGIGSVLWFEGVKWMGKLKLD